MASKYRSFLNYAIPSMIALAIFVIVSQQVRLIDLSRIENTETFYSFSHGLDQYKDLRQEWRPRILSNYLAGGLVNLVESRYHISDQAVAMKYISAYWTVGWLFLTFLLFILLFKQKSLLYIFGIFAGISFAFMPSLGIPVIYPWDMPALFIFCCFVAIIKTEREAWLVVFIPIAMLFKETALLMVAAFLFWEGASLRRKLLFIGITLMASLLLKAGVDLITANPSPVLTMTFMTAKGAIRIVDNFHRLLRLRVDNPIFVDAGLMAALLLLPTGKRPFTMFKLIAVAFVLGNFIFGVITEYRIWFEMLPISLYALDIYFFSSETVLPASGKP
jgi:hypothetical protein